MANIEEKDIKSKITIKVNYYDGLVKEFTFFSEFDVQTSKKTAIKLAVLSFGEEEVLEDAKKISILSVEPASTEETKGGSDE